MAHDIEAIENIIRTKYGTDVEDALALPTRYFGAEAHWQQPSSGRFAHFAYSYEDAREITIERGRLWGSVIVDLWSPMRLDVSEDARLARQIAAVFDRLDLAGPPVVRFGRTRPRRPVNDDKRSLRRRTLELPFRTDEP